MRAPGDFDPADFDPALARKLARLVAAHAAWNRLAVDGLENIPPGPALLVANHNGGAAIVDGLFLLRHYERTGFADPVHILAHDFMFVEERWARFVARGGIVRASHENSHAVFQAGRKLLVFPGSDYDSMRPFAERKRVKFGGHTGFARLALAAGVPIVPIAIAGAHEGFIVLRQGRRLSQWLGVKRFLRWHSLPLAFMLPWGFSFGYLPYLPMPAKVSFKIAPPLDVNVFAANLRVPAGRLAEVRRSQAHARRLSGASAVREDDSDAEVMLYETVQDTIQRMLDELYATRRFPILG